MSYPVYLLTYGDGSDGDEWGVISIHSSLELAEKAKAKYEEPIKTRHGMYQREAQIESWTVDEADRPSWRKDDDTLEDGFGSVWSAWCPVCHNKSISVVRPGKVQCDECG